MGKKLTFEDLYQKDHYRGIIELLFFYGDKENGLRQQHFRYRLMDNPIFSKKKETQEKKMNHFKRFFETGGIYICASDEFKKSPQFKELNAFGVVKGCIKSRQKLTNYLKTLKEMKVITKSSKNKPDTQWKLTDHYRIESLKQIIKHNIDKYADDTIYNQWRHKELLDDKYNATGTTGTGHENWVLFGLSPVIVGNFTPLEKKRLKEYLDGVEENLSNILKIAFNKKRKGQRTSDICFSFIGHRWK